MENRLEKLLGNEPFISDGGLETDMIFNRGIDLPHNAAFTMYDLATGKDVLNSYFIDFIKLALQYKVNFILETPTWRSNPEWGAKLGYAQKDLSRINAEAVEHMQSIRAEFETETTQIVVSGNIGPRGDGYKPGLLMNEADAAQYHLPQIEVFRDSGVDMVSAFTMNYVEEALGIVNAAKSREMPVVISFTVETDGALPSGEPLEEAIATIDQSTENYPLYYMINCAHPQHFKKILDRPGTAARLKGIRANSSSKSHEELDNSVVIDKGDKELLASEYKMIHDKLPGISVIGGCCGTDHTHIEQMCKKLFN